MVLIMNHESLIKNLKSEDGFSLIELLLYMTLASVILLVVSVFSFSLIQARIKNQTVAEVEQQGIQVMQTFTQTIRNAEGITVPGQGGSGNTLTLDVVTAGDDPTTFSDVSGVIQMTEGTNPTVDLTSSRVIASNLTFENLSRDNTPGTVRISFTLTHINDGGRNEYDYEKTFTGSASLRY